MEVHTYTYEDTIFSTVGKLVITEPMLNGNPGTANCNKITVYMTEETVRALQKMMTRSITLLNDQRIDEIVRPLQKMFSRSVTLLSDQQADEEQHQQPTNQPTNNTTG